MKKLRLKALSLGAKEILNREQLKSIHGGDGSGSGGGGGGAGYPHPPYNYSCGCFTPNFNYIHFGCDGWGANDNFSCASIGAIYCLPDGVYGGWNCLETPYDCEGVNPC